MQPEMHASRLGPEEISNTILRVKRFCYNEGLQYMYIYIYMYVLCVCVRFSWKEEKKCTGDTELSEELTCIQPSVGGRRR